MAEGFSAFVHWPNAPLTDSLVRKALSSIHITPKFLDHPTVDGEKLLQWASYDSIDHDLTLENQADVLSSSYIIRKALIRKHFLSRCIHAYLLKHPDSALQNAVPQTWDLEISFADELDDMWADELWDLGKDMDESEAEGRGKWWILKPGMADRGMGIRLFNSKDALQQIFEGFEENESDGDVSDAGDVDAAPLKDDTAVVTSQLRHFVIQEYILSPLLLDPYQFPVNGCPVKEPEHLKGYKFHLRTYCVASGALKLYFYDRILALFSSEPFGVPVAEEDGPSSLSLAPHLTNTSLQTHRGEEGVRLLDELVGCKILSGDEQERLTLTAEHLVDIQNQIADVLGETFRAALGTAIHFQALPNAFELYGIDFLVSHVPSAASTSPKFQVKILEVNAEPAIELTGPRLTWILEDLFKSVGTVCVEQFFQKDKETPNEAWAIGETKHHLRKCLEAEVRGAGGW
ncbi:tubulin-tyrosine ligase [Dentipellis sp. KUC8613]|nr:tubulin-tyrosine ligase [Dentipellis sp. KUC8613]